MEICILILLYYLSQNPDFANSVQPIMHQLKDSERMLSFLNDLSKFTQTLSECQKTPSPPPKQEHCKEEKRETGEKNSQSPTEGIANTFIQEILDSYLKNNSKR